MDHARPVAFSNPAFLYFAEIRASSQGHPVLIRELTRMYGAQVAGLRMGAAAGLCMGAALLAGISENPYKYGTTLTKLQLAQALVDWMTVAREQKRWLISNY